jgi:monovalent cation:H+ antiporter-2, CPA2 family
MELAILIDIVIIFAFATAVNYLFTRINIPTIIGYLLTGIVVGPSVLSVIHSVSEIDFMAEIGVVLLMFTIGLELSLNHLIKIRNVVFFGGFMQLIFTAGFTALVAHWCEMSWSTSVFVGFLTALSSTALVLKILQERGELTSNYGHTVVGILIFQDIILIPLMLLTPMLGGETTDIGARLLGMGSKTVFMVALVYVGNRWIMPRVLHLIALTKNQELFLMSILLICLSVAVLSEEMGMSLAFGAFLGGLMISRSEYSQNAFSHLVPFKDTFTSFFFVSIGMMLNLNFFVEHFWIVIGAVALVIAIKIFVAGGTAFVLGHTFRGTVVIGFALAQIGEFSFILAKIGQSYQVLSDYLYQLFLAVSIVSMVVSPFLIMVAKPAANLLLNLPIPKFLINGLFPLKEIEVPEMQHHIVIIGKDSRSLNLSRMACQMKLPYVSIIFDPAEVRKRQLKGEMAVYGDAMNEPILKKAHVETARIVVISIGDAITALGVIEKVRLLNKHADIIVRAKYVSDIEDLYKMGADQVIPEEFETAMDLFERILKKMYIPKGKIDATLSLIRDDNYGIFLEKEENTTFVLSDEIPDIEIATIKVSNHLVFEAKSLLELGLREKFSLTVVAVKRGEQITENPPANLVFEKSDIVYLLGKPENIALLTEAK